LGAMKGGWVGSAGSRIRQADQAPSKRQAFVCAVLGGPGRTGGELGCAVVRHS
jgi:hypothetical protein